MPLTPVELQVLRYASKGFTARATAAEINRGIETVKTHRKCVLFKLEARNIAHAVAIAFRKGLIE